MAEFQKVTDYSIGMENITKASQEQLFDLIEHGDLLYQNLLLYENIPRYISGDKNEIIDHQNVFGDIFSSNVYLNQQIKNLEKRILICENKNRELTDKILQMRGDIDDLAKNLNFIREKNDKHLEALENNLRTLKETLTYE